MNSTRTAIQKLAGTYGVDLVHALTCAVDAVSAAGRTCMVTPINDNLASFTAQLMAETDDGLLILPAIGSTVVVLFSALNAPTVIQFSQIDKLYYVAGGSTIQMDGGGVQLMGSSYGGMVEVAALVGKINALENDLNTLKNIFSSWVVIPNDGGGALYALLATYKTALFNPLTQRSDLENTLVKHGDGG